MHKLTKKKRTKKTRPEAVRRLIEPDPLDEIAPQAKELLDRVLELRALTPVLSDAKKLAADTESRIRVLQQELDDVLNGLLPGMPPDQVPKPCQVAVEPEAAPWAPTELPVPIQEPDGGDFPGLGDDEEPTVEAYNEPLRDRSELSAKTVASCNQAGLMTVGKVVEFWASRFPFSKIQGIGPVEDKELRALVHPFRPLLPQIRTSLGMA